MKKLLTAFFIMIAVTLLMANHAPRVEDINFSQRDDGSYIVDIYYNVFDQDGDLLTITIFAFLRSMSLKKAALVSVSITENTVPLLP